MNEQSSGIKERIVSALAATLKLLLKIGKAIIHAAGVLIIDKGMRSVVGAYDVRNGKQKAGSPRRDSRGQAQNCDARIAELERMADQYRRDLQSAHNEINSMRSERGMMIQDTQILRDNLADEQRRCQQLASQIEVLKSNVDALQKRCLPASEIPALVYYAEGDASGLSLRKVSVNKSRYHIYRLRTVPGDTSRAEFEPDVAPGYLPQVIANRHLTLIACEVVGIAGGATRIEVLESGSAVCENRVWKVTKKAKIRLS
ncbi:MAG: hypothetical protein K2O78_07385 [Muribaculaceae bacterium]|nr:hypothetical protein [Muribaculaceae bacterium]